MDQARRRSEQGIGMASFPQSHAFPPAPPSAAMSLIPPGCPGTKLPGLGGMWSPEDHAAVEKNKREEQDQVPQRSMVQGSLPGNWNQDEASQGDPRPDAFNKEEDDEVATPESARGEKQQTGPEPNIIVALNEILMKLEFMTSNNEGMGNSILDLLLIRTLTMDANRSPEETSARALAIHRIKALQANVDKEVDARKAREHQEAEHARITEKKIRWTRTTTLR